MKLSPILSVMAVSISAVTFASAQIAPGSYASPVPRFTFSDTPEEQEKELAAHSSVS